MTGYDFVTDQSRPHVGGNIYQGDPWTFAPKVWRYMIDRFAVNSVLDIGSGRGHAAHWFYKNGCKVIAIDGEFNNVNTALYPTVLHDLTDKPFTCPVDMVHCQEVVEHIEEKHVDKLLATLMNGNVIIMSHAEPGQEGYHHVNLKPQAYWVKQMAGAGFSLLPDDTMRVRRLASEEQAHHLARSGLVFAKHLIPNSSYEEFV